ncbi:nucleoside hydrolase [Alteromonas aestuariivivens]|uniref:Nucleoside hydrolase n=1 Tax=Alteromonas aestuariivivens TaxID=1938339 RepID=A0A3D8MB42_9ALTE|nr:nucleoside hydrolase [Alteromonas aestuariivivens]RDV27468.1 nucleoside hydrolase [Alteromonas aestuariivivens]
MTDTDIRRKVIFDHDGGIDDLLSLILLLSLPTVDLQGVSITPADCYADDALTSTLKLLTLTGQTHIPVSVGELAGPNPFPPDWRAQPKICHSVPAMLRVSENRHNVVSQPAHEWMASFLMQSDEPITVLMTGPATNLAWVLSHHPELAEKIEQVIWMGGAINVKGNVAMHDHDGSAEWNAYWDPKATETLIASQVPVCLVPLDATNALPVDRAFLRQLADCQTEVSDLAGQFWAATVTAIPAYEFTYFLWDILATSVLGLEADCYRVRSGRVVVDTQSPSAGRISLAEGAPGHFIEWLEDVDGDRVRAFVLKQFSRQFNEFNAANC